MKESYNATEAAKAAGISRQTLYTWIASRRFVPERAVTGAAVTFTAADIKALRAIEKVPGAGGGRPRASAAETAAGNEIGERLELYRCTHDKTYAQLAALISGHLPEGQSVGLGTVRNACLGKGISKRARFKIERFLDSQASVQSAGGVAECAQGG